MCIILRLCSRRRIANDFKLSRELEMATFQKVQWSEEEDAQLRTLVERHGPKKWALIAQSLKPKQAKQCRRRWQNVLNANLKDGEWSIEVR